MLVKNVLLEVSEKYERHLVHIMCFLCQMVCEISVVFTVVTDVYF